MPQSDIEIIINDFGSGRSFQKELMERSEHFDALVVATMTREVWNRARAINMGIRAARGHYLLCTDADMIFAPNFVSTLIETQKRYSDNAFVV